MKIGIYALEEIVTDDNRLEEIPEAEMQSLQKTFVGEQIRRAPSASFLDLDWDLWVGTIDGRIYKLSALFADESSALADEVFSKATIFCDQQYGRPVKHPNACAMMWRTPFGNIVVDRQSVLGHHCVNFHATSRKLVRSAILKSNTVRWLVILIIIAVALIIYAWL